jgi:hypothetical protein
VVRIVLGVQLSLTILVGIALASSRVSNGGVSMVTPLDIYMYVILLVALWILAKEIK